LNSSDLTNKTTVQQLIFTKYNNLIIIDLNILKIHFTVQAKLMYKK